eukprot:GFUD01021508.1.p1 GENE.GFUD01021508.1~~GFUD01021508.1.p1  ORF type:complete len:334 (+),score=80.55 GFUD01021508.1:201-1202(+)
MEDTDRNEYEEHGVEQEIDKSHVSDETHQEKHNGSAKTTADPFYVRLLFTPLDFVSMAFLSITLVPIRMVAAFIALTLAWAVSCIGLTNIDQTVPVSGWRKPLQWISCFLGRICCRCCGFSVTITGTQVPKSVAPVLVVAPHSSFFDALAIFWTGLPFIVNREENKNLLFIGKCVQFAQAIFVSRERKESREECKEEIKRRVNSKQPWEQFLIFPEGTTSNRKALMSFKPGGFLPGKPVQPVLIRYHLKHDTVSWTWDQPHGFIACFMYTMFQLRNKVELEFLPPYEPSEPEQMDPVLFASNVRQEMSNALGVPLCDMSYEDIKNKYSKKKEQ